jgi:hypothetical protein
VPAAVEKAACDMPPDEPGGAGQRHTPAHANAFW